MAKTAHLTLDSPGIFALKSTYDAALVALIKSMPPSNAPGDDD